MQNVAPTDIFEGEYEVDVQSTTINGEKFDVICVFYGWAPVTPLPDTINCQYNQDGFFVVDDCGRTSHPDIFAIGECANKSHPCVVTAMAEGVEAAKAIQKDLEQKN